MRRRPAARSLFALLACVALLSACAQFAGYERELWVTATAYNSLRAQTGASPSIAAWGDRLRPGMRVVAVSRDLEAMGLTRGARLRIQGLAGEYQVLDRMASRWRKRIDIYMGTDVEAARRFGRRRVKISWSPPGVGRAGWF